MKRFHIEVGDQKFISRSSEGLGRYAWEVFAGLAGVAAESLDTFRGSFFRGAGPRFSTDSAR